MDYDSLLLNLAHAACLVGPDADDAYDAEYERLERSVGCPANVIRQRELVLPA